MNSNTSTAIKTQKERDQEQAANMIREAVAILLRLEVEALESELKTLFSSLVQKEPTQSPVTWQVSRSKSGGGTSPMTFRELCPPPERALFTSLFSPLKSELKKASPKKKTSALTKESSKTKTVLASSKVAPKKKPVTKK